MDPSALAALFALALVNVVVPGPCAMLVSGTRLVGGADAAERAVTGVAVGHLAWGVAAGGGVVAVLERAPEWFLAVKLGGALYVFVMGSRLLWAAAPAVGASARIERGGFVPGLLTALANPSVALFYLAVVPAVSGERPVVGEIAVVALLHAGMCAWWFSALARVLGRGTLGSAVAMRRVLRGCALALMGFGIGLAATA